MVARNFLRNGFHLWYPQVDLAGPNPGTWGAEFQIYPFLVALLYKLFGIREWLGLLLSSVFALGAGSIFYLLVRGFLGKVMGLLSLTLLNILPVSVYFTRAFMPESLMVFASVLSVFFIWKWFLRRNWLWLIPSGLSLALAILLKANAGYLLVPVGWFFWKTYRIKLLLRWQVWMFLLVSLLPPVLWYQHARNLEFAIDVLHPGSDPKWGSFTFWFSWQFYHRVFLQWACEQTLLYPGYALALLGLLWGWRDPNIGLFKVWLLGVVLSFFLVAGGTIVHVYYTLPLVLPGVVFTAYSMTKLWFLHQRNLRPWARGVVIVSFIVIAGASVEKLLRWTKPDGATYRAALMAKELTPPGGLLLACDDGQPELLYYSDRKGWHLHPEECSPELLRGYAEKGARFFLTSWFGDLARRPALSGHLQTHLRSIRQEDNIYLGEFR
jgi:4-amino-4-deoxy-L-arabinose transferase-like glycosyltransferase